MKKNNPQFLQSIDNLELSRHQTQPGISVVPKKTHPVLDSLFDSEVTEVNKSLNNDIPSDITTLKQKEAQNIINILGEIKSKLSARDDSIFNSLSRIENEKANNDIIKQLKEEAKEAHEIIADIKTKLQLKEEMLKLYEKQQNEIMDILGVPKEDRSFSKVLHAIKGMKKSFNEKEEEKNYIHADGIINDFFQEKSGK